jgi:hypothetical protein
MQYAFFDAPHMEPYCFAGHRIFPCMERTLERTFFGMHFYKELFLYRNSSTSCGQRGARNITALF